MILPAAVFRFLCISCGIILAFVDRFNFEAIAKTRDNQFQGETISIEGKKVSEYLGVRYAAPPVGNLRFRKPQPHSTDDIISSGINESKSCWQLSKYPFPWYEYHSPKSEDCLFLNIWAPDDASPDNKKAVFYWVFGGGFRFGSIRDEMNNGATLAALGDIIVVTVNYRVGPFGFFYSGTDDAPGNVGIWDILEGLKWVNANIEAFGGDKSKITIGGESSGSYAVGLLSVSPLAKGLFRRQIMESSSPVHLDKGQAEENMKLSQNLAERLHCANETITLKKYPSAVVDCMKKTNPRIIAAVDSTISPSSIITYIPQFGDELLPQDPIHSVKERKMICNEVLIGNTLDEGSVLITTAHPSFYGFFGQKNPHVDRKAGEWMIRDRFKEFVNPNALVTHYLPSNITDSNKIRKQLSDVVGDFRIVCPSAYYAEKCAEDGGKVYYYVWKERPNNYPWSPWMGVAHTSELPFVFGEPVKHPDYFPAHQAQLSRSVIGIWSSFVKTGNPGFPWPLYSKSNPVVKYFGPNNTVDEDGKGPQIDNCNFFRPYYGF